MDDMVCMSPGDIKSVEYIKELIETKTRLTQDISIHTSKEIEDIREYMPKLGPLVGAMKIHEVLISSSGIIKKKNLPSDVFYQHVNIKESRRYRRVSGDVQDDEELVDYVYSNKTNNLFLHFFI